MIKYLLSLLVNKGVIISNKSERKINRSGVNYCFSWHCIKMNHSKQNWNNVNWNNWYAKVVHQHKWKLNITMSSYFLRAAKGNTRRNLVRVIYTMNQKRSKKRVWYLLFGIWIYSLDFGNIEKQSWKKRYTNALHCYFFLYFLHKCCLTQTLLSIDGITYTFKCLPLLIR